MHSRIYALVFVGGITTQISCQSDQPETLQTSESQIQSFQSFSNDSCSANEINGSCTLTRNGHTETFRTSAERACKCPVPADFADMSLPNLPGNGDMQGFQDFHNKAIDQQIAQLQSMNMPTNILSDMIKNLESLKNINQGIPVPGIGSTPHGTWPDVASIGDLSGMLGGGNHWSNNCSSNYVNGQCIVSKNGDAPSVTWAQNFSECSSKCL